MRILAKTLRRCWADEEGAVTVDWVVLTALIVGLAAPLGINYVGQLTGATQVVSSNIKAMSSLIPATLP
ncbi:MAG: hypothetical protein D6754_00170 [Alphaproteobacteria bacterium]|nr:MAG: hypothetical protein D6754_00170 [Alphaproteobacteria bacterium]